MAKILGDNGIFVLQLFLPDVARFDRGQRTGTLKVEAGSVYLEAAKFDLLTQRVDAVHVFLEDGEPVRLFPVRIRFSWPNELDLMARLAGLHLRERWGGWKREPFTSASAGHISIYERAPA